MENIMRRREIDQGGLFEPDFSVGLVELMCGFCLVFRG